MENTENDNKNWKKEEVLALMDEKQRIESEMAEWTEVLSAQGGVGMHEPLVDAEGIWIFIFNYSHIPNFVIPKFIIFGSDIQELLKESTFL